MARVPVSDPEDWLAEKWIEKASVLGMHHVVLYFDDETELHITAGHIVGFGPTLIFEEENSDSLSES